MFGQVQKILLRQSGDILRILRVISYTELTIDFCIRILETAEHPEAKEEAVRVTLAKLKGFRDQLQIEGLISDTQSSEVL